MGLWMSPLNVTRKHDKRFDTEWRPRGCSNKYVVLHKQTAKEMYEKHERLMASDFGRQCNKEYLERAEYEYDWSKPPSKCCPGRGRGWQAAAAQCISCGRGSPLLILSHYIIPIYQMMLSLLNLLRMPKHLWIKVLSIYSTTYRKTISTISYRAGRDSGVIYTTLSLRYDPPLSPPRTSALQGDAAMHSKAIHNSFLQPPTATFYNLLVVYLFVVNFHNPLLASNFLPRCILIINWVDSFKSLLLVYRDLPWPRSWSLRSDSARRWLKGFSVVLKILDGKLERALLISFSFFFSSSSSSSSSFSSFSSFFSSFF